MSISGTSYESPPGNKKHALRGPEEIQLMNFAKVSIDDNFYDLIFIYTARE